MSDNSSLRSTLQSRLRAKIQGQGLTVTIPNNNNDNPPTVPQLHNFSDTTNNTSWQPQQTVNFSGINNFVQQSKLPKIIPLNPISYPTTTTTKDIQLQDHLSTQTQRVARQTAEQQAKV